MKTSSWITIPSAVWDSLCVNYEAAYAWGNVRWKAHRYMRTPLSARRSASKSSQKSTPTRKRMERNRWNSASPRR